MHRPNVCWNNLKRRALAWALVGLAALASAHCGDATDPGDDEAPSADAGLPSDAGRDVTQGRDVPSPDVSDALDDADDDAADSDVSCAPGLRVCADPRSVAECNATGDGYEVERCTSEERCDPDALACLPIVCVPATAQGCADAERFIVCNATGTGTFTAPCPGGVACVDNACEATPCEPGRTICTDAENVQTCRDDGSGYDPPVTCPRGQECDEGACVDLCTINAKKSSYLGCEYWSADLDNYDDALSQPHAVVVSNPSEELEANITITRGYDTPITLTGPATLPPLGQGVYSMPLDAQVSTVEVSDKAFRVTSNVPVTVHQFNPLNNVGVFSNDGTLLLPTNALGTRYYIMGWEQRPDPPLRGFMTLINTSGQNNQVTVTFSASTAPGPEIPRYAPGDVAVFDMAPGEVLNVATSQAGTDLTGTYVESLFPIAAFGGHECANVLVGIDRCDHIETQLFPVSTWGTTYVGTKFFPRGTEPDVWRVLASEDATILSTDPPIPDIDGAVVNRGEFLQFESSRTFQLTATAPVSLGHYMVGANWFGIPRTCTDGEPVGIGDPALTVSVPIEQYRNDYIVLTPESYAQDYLNIVAPIGATVVLDGELVAEELFEPVGDIGTPFVAALLPVEDGPHRVTADLPIGLEAYGYDCRVSYAYPGGLNLEVASEQVEPDP